MSNNGGKSLAESHAPLEVFCSYAHEDERFRQKLETQLSPLRRQGLIKEWYDSHILPGSDWARDIGIHLESASIILLLISGHYFASEYCYNIEMKRALQRAQVGEVYVLPILLSEVHWKDAPFKHLQVLPTSAKPITAWHDQDAAFADVVAGIHRVITNHYSPIKNTHPPSNVFYFSQQLLSPEEFYGRARERFALLDRTHKGACTSIVGPRRIGKTWLINYLKLTADQELGANFLIKYLDATTPRCATVIGFISCVLEGLESQRRIFTQSSEALIALEHTVRDLSRRNQVLVLCIDEFEGFGNHLEFDLTFFTALRALTQEGLCLVVASKDRLIDIVGEIGKTSGFFNVFKQCKLGPFTRNEAETFVESKGNQAYFTEQERQKLLEYSQCDGAYWPLRLQLVGETLLEDKMLAERENDPDAYRPEDPLYWQEFEQRIEEIYRGVVR